MPRIRTARQARVLRPIAIERARQSHFHKGDRVFYSGFMYAEAEILLIIPCKPYNSAIFLGPGAAFIGSLADAFPVTPHFTLYQETP